MNLQHFVYFFFECVYYLIKAEVAPKMTVNPWKNPEQQIIYVTLHSDWAHFDTQI